MIEQIVLELAPSYFAYCPDGTVALADDVAVAQYLVIGRCFLSLVVGVCMLKYVLKKSDRSDEERTANRSLTQMDLS